MTHCASDHGPVHLTSACFGRGKLKALRRDTKALQALLHDKCAPGALRILATDETTLALAMALRLVTRAPVGAVLHGTYAVDPANPFERLVLWHAARKARALFPVSRYTADRLRQSLPASVPRLHVANPGVPFRDLPSRSFELRAHKVVSVAAMKPRKGADKLVEALARIPEARRPDLTIMGECKEQSPFVRAVRARIDALGLTEKVTLTGMVSEQEREDAYASARVFALPSQPATSGFEGFGLVHLEANLHGTPAIGCLGCGNEDAIAEGVSGHLVAPDDVSALASAIDRLTNEPEHWQALSQGAYARARASGYEGMAGVIVGAMG